MHSLSAHDMNSLQRLSRIFIIIPDRFISDGNDDQGLNREIGREVYWREKTLKQKKFESGKGTFEKRNGTDTIPCLRACTDPACP